MSAQSRLTTNEYLVFSLLIVAGNPPQFAIVSRDGLSIMLRLGRQRRPDHPNESRRTWDAFFWVDDADALARQLSANVRTWFTVR